MRIEGSGDQQFLVAVIEGAEIVDYVEASMQDWMSVCKSVI